MSIQCSHFVINIVFIAQTKTKLKKKSWLHKNKNKKLLVFVRRMESLHKHINISVNKLKVINAEDKGNFNDCVNLPLCIKICIIFTCIFYKFAHACSLMYIRLIAFLLLIIVLIEICICNFCILESNMNS